MATKQTKQVPETRMREWLTAYQTEPPLHKWFPLSLNNGKRVPALHVVCSECGSTVSGDHVHGRAVQSLPHVITISANGLCVGCSRLTHIDCRFRTGGTETLVEWLGSNGQWCAKEYRRPTLIERIRQSVRKWTAAAIQ